MTKIELGTVFEIEGEQFIAYKGVDGKITVLPAGDVSAVSETSHNLLGFSASINKLTLTPEEIESLKLEWLKSQRPIEMLRNGRTGA